ARFSSRSGPVVTTMSGPNCAAELFGTADLTVAKAASTDCLLSYWRLMATFGDVSLPLQSYATKNARDTWKPGPLERFCGTCVSLSLQTSRPASLSVVCAGS